MGSKLFLRDTLVFWTSAMQAGVPGTNSCLSLCSEVKGLVSKSKVSQVIYRGSCHSSCRGCWLAGYLLVESGWWWCFNHFDQ